VTSGSQQALDLIARTLLQEGDAIWVEDPGYFGARWAFQRAGLRVIPTAVDSDGLDVVASQVLSPDAHAAYVTPSHQFP
jgi:GntR family transcriptional regulator / MocR family aminotransferase